MNLLDFLKKEDVKNFIRDNIRTDPSKLILNPPQQFKEGIKSIVDQIIARKKAKGKLDNWSDNLDLIMPPPISIEQASSETTSEYKQKLISGRHLVDLTGGMGIDCIALSEKFDTTTYVEQNTELYNVFRHNADILKKSVSLENETAEQFLRKNNLNARQTTHYIDPARRDQSKNRIFRIEDCSPNLIELLPILKEKSSCVLVKYSPFLDLKEIIRSIPNLKEIHIVSVKNDCKELLLLIDFNQNESPKIFCSNLVSDQPQYSFFFHEEFEHTATLGELGSFLLEPNASILKAGAFDKIAKDFKIKKLGKNTQFYSSEEKVVSFPGRIFKVISTATKKTIKETAIDGKINVIARNYPLSAIQLKKKWKVKDGGNYFLIAYRDLNNSPRMIIAKRVHP